VKGSEREGGEGARAFSRGPTGPSSTVKIYLGSLGEVREKDHFPSDESLDANAIGRGSPIATGPRRTRYTLDGLIKKGSPSRSLLREAYNAGDVQAKSKFKKSESVV